MNTSVTKGKEPIESPKMEFVSFFLNKTRCFSKLGPVTFFIYLPIIQTSKVDVDPRSFEFIHDKPPLPRQSK